MKYILVFLLFFSVGFALSYLLLYKEKKNVYLQLLSGLCSGGMAAYFLQKGVAVAGFFGIFSCVLIIISFIDFRTQNIPDKLQYFLLFPAMGLALLDGTGFMNHLIGFMIGGGGMALIYWLGLFVLKRETLGLGDVKLMAVIGLAVGIFGIGVTLFLSFFLALPFVFYNRKNEQGEVAFAPYISAATILTVLFSDVLIGWITSFVL